MTEANNSHYFNPSPETPHHLSAFTEDIAGKLFKFVSDSSTFSRKGLDDGSRLLIETSLAQLNFSEGERVLDLGCGWGPIGTILKYFHPRIDLVFSDINERAVHQAKTNFANNIKDASAEFYNSDGFTEIEGEFDKIFLNPPIRAGKQVVYRLYQESFDKLKPGGQLAIVIRKKQGADSSKKELDRIFGLGQVEDIARKSGYRILLADKEG